MEFQYLFIVNFKERAVIDPNATVSRRTLALEHAHHRLTFFFEELPSARIREAPQLPVVWQISRSLRNPRRKNQIQIPGLLIVLHGPVSHVTDEAMYVEGKPLQELTASRTHRYRSHDLLGCGWKNDRWSGLAQQEKTVGLCTYCGDVVQVVDEGGKGRLSEIVRFVQGRRLFYMLAFMSRDITRAGIFIRCFSNHLQERADFCSQWTMARMNYVEASTQRFGVEQFHGGELMRS